MTDDVKTSSTKKMQPSELHQILPTVYEGRRGHRGLRECTHRASALAKPGASARLLELLALTERAPTSYNHPMVQAVVFRANRVRTAEQSCSGLG